MDKLIRHQANPEVSCREEGADGALLFQPDTADLMVINPTGLLIWRELARPRTKDEISSYLLKVCTDATYEQVDKDVSAFLGSLTPGEFVIEVGQDDAP